MAAESLDAAIELIDDQSLVYATPDGALHYDSRIERMFPWVALGVPLRRLLDTAAGHAVDQPGRRNRYRLARRPQRPEGDTQMITEPGIYTMPAARISCRSVPRTVAQQLRRQAPGVPVARPRLGRPPASRRWCGHARNPPNDPRIRRPLGHPRAIVGTDRVRRCAEFHDQGSPPTARHSLGGRPAAAARERPGDRRRHWCWPSTNAGLFDASMRELSQFEATLCWREGPSWHRCRVGLHLPGRRRRARYAVRPQDHGHRRHPGRLGPLGHMGLRPCRPPGTRGATRS